MSEYVPSAREIREVWAAFSDYGGLVVPDQLRHAPCWEDRLAEFDRWLNRIKADAWDEGYQLDWTGGVRHVNPYREAGQ